VELEGGAAMTGVSRGRRLRRWILWISGGLALLLVGGFVFIVGLGMHVRAHNPTVRVLSGMDSSTATEPVTVTMGKVVLRIPRNYFLSMPSHDIAGRPDGIEFSLLGLMPDFEPRTDANRKEFDDFQGMGRKLKIFVAYKGYTKTGKDLFLTAYNRKHCLSDKGAECLSRGPVTDGEFGYQSFKINIDDELFRGSVDDPKDFIECRAKEQIVPPGEKPLPYFPHCERIVLAGEDIVAQFSFSRDFLGNAHDVERQMIDTLNRFRISGPVLEVIQ
jgi:hypothetical protein